MKYKIVILLLAVLLTGCKAKKVVEQRRSTDSIHVQSIEAMSVGGLTREQNSERIVVVSIMELDTTTGAELGAYRGGFDYGTGHDYGSDA